MQHPQHSIVTMREPMSTPRMTGLALVGALHVALVYALVTGLVAPITKAFTPPIDIVAVKQVEPRTDPPRSRVVMLTPTSVAAVPPVVVVDTNPSGGPFTTTQVSTPPSPLTPDMDVPARAIAGTHTIPDYPALARRLGQEGTVQLKLTIAPDGSVREATVEHSSGSDVLDRAAVEWVMAHWRYRPSLRDGAPDSSTMEAAVKFDLRKS